MNDSSFFLDRYRHHTLDQIDRDFVDAHYQELTECVLFHNELYYRDDNPQITDREYDQLFSLLKACEQRFPDCIDPKSPTQTLAGQNTIAQGFQKAEHVTPLLSLDNSYDAQDILDFGTFVSKNLAKHEITQCVYTLEPKYDGVSIELIYENSIFKQAITRGDGYIGEDVTANVKTINNIPQLLKKPGLNLRVRGEIVLPISRLNALNSLRTQENIPPFANTRNAASGSLKLLDAGQVSQRGLLCYVYDVLSHEQVGSVADRDLLIECGFSVYPRYHSDLTIDQVVTLCTDLETKHFFQTQDIEFDGLVIKVADLAQRLLLGATNHHPRRAIAYKFPAQQVSTRLIDVHFQVGRTGILTPVAHLEPVSLSGVTISRSSLHNEAFILQKNIHKGDTILLQRSGEVIPYIIGVDHTKPNDQKTQISFPSQCPECKSTIIKEDDMYYCVNPDCPAQLREKLQHRVSKDCLDIDGLGESTIHLLVDQGLLNSLAELYHLDQQRTHLITLPGLGAKKIQEMLTGINASKTKVLWRILHGLSIPHIGKKTAQMIQDAYSTFCVNQNIKPTVQTLIDFMSNEEQLGAIYGIGKEIIQGSQVFFALPATRHLLAQLDQGGLHFDVFESKALRQGPLSDMSFCITGTFPVAREKIVSTLESQGATFSSNVTKSLTFLLVGKNPSSKLSKAQESGIKILTLDELSTFAPGISLTALQTPVQQVRQEGLF